ncbi:MAG: site-specific integrase [Bacteroides sp.]|nr:site-specific integrase [Bacteroides sp.]
MATVKRSMTSKLDGCGNAEILLRLSVSRKLILRLRSSIFIKPERFKDCIFRIPRANPIEANEIREIENAVINMERFLINLCETTSPSLLTKEYINEQLELYKHPPVVEEPKVKEVKFFDVFDQFISSRNLSEWRIKHYNVLIRALMRFELYKRATGQKRYKIQLDRFSLQDVNEFEKFLRSEEELYEKYPEIYEAAPADTRRIRKKPKPLPKGDNTIVCMFGRLRAFFNWCNEQKLTENKPFQNYCGNSVEKYGTPYYITIEERDQIADYDLSSNPGLEAQRDIFIFQCLIGCRVSDLLAMTHDNIINGAIEYMPQKTKGERPRVVRVPLNNRALALIEKYKDQDCGGKLFPFISAQKYNVAIKKAFTIAGVTRMVTILNPATSREEKRPINEIASSHLARRTFVGNLYKKVKDPNLVGSLSGHVEGSKAFARYREIDEDMKKELVGLLE